MIRISEHPAPLLQSSGLFSVDVSLHAGLSSGDEDRVPQSQPSESNSHRAGQNPEKYDTLVRSGLHEGELRRRGLVVALHSIVGLKEHVPAVNTAVDTAQGHVEAEGEEVAVVKMADTVVQPGTVVVHL